MKEELKKRCVLEFAPDVKDALEELAGKENRKLKNFLETTLQKLVKKTA